MKFKSIFKRPNESDKLIGVFDTREEAINACVDYDESRHYCLDNKEDRIECLRLRNYCICGCGPDELAIEEVE